jgi:uncharacterized protein (DUF1800 family)
MLRSPSLPLLALVSAFLAFVVPSARADDARLANLSTRAAVGSGSNVMISGFVIGPGAAKTVLIRAVGPTLANAPFNIPGTLASPSLALFNSAGTQIKTNSSWLAADAATMTSVGAFPLPAGSRDAALVTTLDPGAYTAQVSGVGDTTGLAILEVYEVGATSASSRLINLSTRAQVTGGTGVLIAGLVIAPGTGSRQLLIRAIGPALTVFGLPGALADPTITVTNGAGTTTYATNDNWGTPVGTGAVDAAFLTAAFTQAGAFALAPGSKDAALVVSVPAGSYTVQVNGVGGTSGLALVEVYDLTPAGPPVVTVTATKAASDKSGANNGEFTVSRSGSTLSPLTINYSMSGGAINAFDYTNLPGTVTIPAGASSAKIALNPLPDVQAVGTKSAILTLLDGAGVYASVAPASATVTITNSPATLYFATLRPETGATGSTSSGTATILLSSSGTLVSINVAFTNLSSAETGAHLRLGANGDFVFNLGVGQVSGSIWNFTPTGNYTSTDLLNALKTGNIYVGIDTAKYPAGEVKGTFIQSTGSQAFTAPAAPPAVALAAATATDASRFLSQATFGPKKSEIDALTGGNIDAWITAQLALPFSSHRVATVADRTIYGGSSSFTNWNAIHPPNRQSAWFKLALTAPDQLRQRVAYALSEILVVSDVALGDDNQAEAVANYYDLLGNGAFGNFRTLLENVTLSPMMGLYLSSLRNAKADPVLGQTPDENFAREVMQLFTIGLEQLQPDGAFALDASGLPIPTYNQTTITQMAKVFTGWSYASTNLNAFRTAGTSYYTPMQLYPAFHDDTVKDLSPLSATPIPANQGGALDLKLALDTLCGHANTPQFISKRLIQRLVTSNPSPAYVYRVAEIFRNDGTGQRGNLGAVVRAILTDYEARSPVVAANPTYGKLEEPLLRLTGILRSFNASSTSGRFLGYASTVDSVPINGTTPKPAAASQINISPSPYSSTRLDSVQYNLAQAPLRSPTVFNFYHTDYVLPGPLAAAGLVAPEFEITDDNFAINVPNFLRTFVNSVTPTSGGVPTPAAPYALILNIDYESTLVATPAALLDHLSLVLTSGTLSTAVRARITSALAALPASATTADRVRTALLLVATSQNAAVQR